MPTLTHHTVSLNLDAALWSAFVALCTAQQRDPATRLQHLLTLGTDEILHDVVGWPRQPTLRPEMEPWCYEAAVHAVAEWLSAKDQVPLDEAEHRAADCLRIIAGEEGEV